MLWSLWVALGLATVSAVCFAIRCLQLEITIERNEIKHNDEVIKLCEDQIAIIDRNLHFINENASLKYKLIDMQAELATLQGKVVDYDSLAKLLEFDNRGK